MMDDDTDMMKEEKQTDTTDSKVASSSASSSSLPTHDPLQVRLISDPKLRFILELEFVELLASPQYLQFLAQSRYLVDPAFLNYLSYLQYWHSPRYIKYLSHPHCLYFLDLLQTPLFRTSLLSPAYVNLLHEQQYYQWTSWRYNRFMEAESKREEKRREEEEKREADERRQGKLTLSASPNQ